MLYTANILLFFFFACMKYAHKKCEIFVTILSYCCFTSRSFLSVFITQKRIFLIFFPLPSYHCHFLCVPFLNLLLIVPFLYIFLLRVDVIEPKTCLVLIEKKNTNTYTAIVQKGYKIYCGYSVRFFFSGFDMGKGFHEWSLN